MSSNGERQPLPVFRPIGHLETPWSTPGECPRNGRQPDPAPACRAVVAPAFQPGLAGLESFSHLILIYWMHRASPPPRRSRRLPLARLPGSRPAGP